MTRDEFQKLTVSTWDRLTHLRATKGREYAGLEDVLRNFKRGAELTGSTPLQVALIYASKHYDSIATFIRDKAEFEKNALPERPRPSEPIEGRLDDLINYCLLIQALLEEEFTKSVGER